MSLCFGIIAALLMACSGASAESLQRLEEIARQAPSLDAFLSKPDLVRAYGKALKAYYGRDRFRCESYETILTQLRQIKDKVPGLKERLWERLPGKAISFQQTDAQAGDADEAADLPVSRGTAQSSPEAVEYTLRPMPRRFHGLWNDPSPTGCESEDCGRADMNAPERWAIAFEGAQLYFLERRGQFLDATILVLPAMRQGLRYGWVVLGGAPVLRKRGLFSERRGQAPWTTSLFDLWSAHALETLPVGWAGLMQRQEAAKETAGDPSGSAADEMLSLGMPTKLLGNAHEFLPIDPLAEKIAEAQPRRCFASRTGGAADLLIGSDPKGAKGTGNALVVRRKDGQGSDSGLKARELLLDFEFPKRLGKLGKLARVDQKGLAILLSECLSDDKDAGFRARAALAFAALGPVDVTPHRGGAGPGIPSAFADERVKPALIKALGDPDPEVRGAAAMALARSPGARTQAPSAAATKALNDFVQPSILPVIWPLQPSAASNGNQAAAGAQGQPNATGASLTQDPSAPAGGKGAGASGGDLTDGSRPRDPIAVLREAARANANWTGKGIPTGTLEGLMDRVVGIPDPNRREQALGELAAVMLENRDADASFHALEADVQKHPREMKRFSQILGKFCADCAAAEAGLSSFGGSGR